MEIETLGSAADYRHYLGDVAILTKTGSLNDTNPGVKYTFRDRLGGVAMLGVVENVSGLFLLWRANLVDLEFETAINV